MNDNYIKAEDMIPAVLQRLIAEVRHDRESGITAYNRMHNRHNRSHDFRPRPAPPAPAPPPEPTPDPKSDQEE